MGVVKEIIPRFMSITRYEYEVKVTQIIPKLHDKAKYAGNISFLFKIVDDEKIELRPDLHETYGANEGEAYDKMMERIKEWVELDKKSHATTD